MCLALLGGGHTDRWRTLLQKSSVLHERGLLQALPFLISRSEGAADSAQRAGKGSAWESRRVWPGWPL